MEKLRFRDIKELESLMSEEQKQKAQADFKKYFLDSFGNLEPLLCGPEARAKNNGTLEEYYNESDYLRKIDLTDWD